MDKHIKKALEQGTASITPWKEQVWENIMKQTSEKGTRQARRERNTVGKKRWLSWASVAAVLLTVFVISAPGQAALQRVIDYFAPQITLIEDLEGQEEKTDASLQLGRAGYIIYFDTQRYQLVELDGKDRILPIYAGDASYLPEVYMEIRQVTDKTPEEMAEAITDELREVYLQGKSNFESVENEGLVESPLASLRIVAQGDVKSAEGVTGFGPVEIVYLVDNHQGGTFIITQKLFHEAVEGHGQRFNNMLREFQVVDIRE